MILPLAQRAVWVAVMVDDTTVEAKLAGVKTALVVMVATII